MKKSIALFLCLLMVAALLPNVLPHAAYADERYLEIDETNFPDANFRSWIIDNLDVSGNASTGYYMTRQQVANVWEIRCSEEPISSLIGTSHFTELEVIEAHACGITAIDVTQNEYLYYLDLDDNSVGSIDVSHNPALVFLFIDSNGLTELDVTHNPKLQQLSFNYDSVSSIDLKNNTELQMLSCVETELTALDVSKCTALTFLSCFNNRLTSLDVSKNTALETLYCSSNPLTALDVSKNTALTILNCRQNQLTALDVSKNTVLETLGCNDNQLTNLNVTKNTALTSLNCADNQLTALDVSKNTVLQALYCYNNQLTNLNVTKNTALTVLRCGNNRLTALDVSKNTALQDLRCYDNQLTALDVSKNTALWGLGCENNQLTTLDVSKNTALTYLSCYDNQLTALDVTKNTALEKLSCGFNQLKILDLSNNSALTELSCLFNQLSTLDVSHNTALTSLECDMNGISMLDLSQNVNLESFSSTQDFGWMELTNNDGVYTYDLKELVPIEYMGNVTMEDASNVLDPATGVVTLPEKVEVLRYLYATGRGDLIVEINFMIEPSIKTQPKSQTAADGKTAEFDVEARGSALRYQWYYSKDNGTTWKKLSGKTREFLEIKASATTNGYLYRCEVKNEKGSVTSKSAKLTVSGVKPKIIVQPLKATVKTGKSNTFKVVAAGTGLKYQWYYSKDNGTKWIKLSGKTSASLKIKGSATTNGYLYRCIVKNSKGSVTSKSAKLTVSGVKPKIVVQPKAVSVKSGKTAKFSVVAAGTGLKYQWYYSKNAGKTWTKMSGKTAATLSVKGSKTNNGYLYRCVVKNTKGSVTSKNAKLTVK